MTTPPADGISSNRQDPKIRKAWRPWIACAAIVAAALAAYANSFSGTFVFDDREAIVENHSLRHLTSVLMPPADSTAGGRPILNLSLALNYALGGLDPWGYHLVNLLIHAGAALALFGIVRRTLDRRNAPAGLPFPPLTFAFAVAVLWAVHPLQSESVTYIVQRAESLMGLFYLLTLYGFVRGVSAARGHIWLLLSVLACMCGMASKEVMVTAPVMVFLYDRTFVAGSFLAAWRARRGYYLALAATWIPLGCLIAATGGNRGGSIGFGIGVAWWSYALTQFHAIATYLWLSLWPHPLVFDRAPAWVSGPADVAPYALVVVPLLAATIWMLLRNRPLGFVGAWFAVILAPTSSIVPGTTQLIVEHRMYLSLAAVLTVLASVVGKMGGRRGLAGLALLALPLGIATARRNEAYQSPIALWRDTTGKQPFNPIAHTNLGVALEEAGDMPEASAEFETALRLRPDSPEALTNLGTVFMKTGRTKQGLDLLRIALRLRPSFTQAHIDLGSALVRLDRLPEGIAQYEEALRLDPESLETHNNLGAALARAGRWEEAIAQDRAALRIEPNYAPARYNLGNALARTGSFPAAIAEYREALRLKPDYPEASLNLANALLQSGSPKEAIAQYEETLRLRPDFATARRNLARALEQAGRHAEAAAETGKDGEPRRP